MAVCASPSASAICFGQIANQQTLIVFVKRLTTNDPRLRSAPLPLRPAPTRVSLGSATICLAQIVYAPHVTLVSYAPDEATLALRRSVARNNSSLRFRSTLLCSLSAFFLAAFPALVNQASLGRVLALRASIRAAIALRALNPNDNSSLTAKRIPSATRDSARDRTRTAECSRTKEARNERSSFVPLLETPPSKLVVGFAPS